MKKALITLALAIAVGTFFACGNSSKQQPQEPAEAQNDTIFAPSDSIFHESFLRYAKEQCGLDLHIDTNVWLPSEFMSLDVENSFSASYYTKDDVDLEAMLDDFLQQCINASVVKAIGPDPKCTTVSEARERRIEKLMKNENDPAEGYCYKGEIIYVHNGGKVKAAVNFGHYANNLNTLYFKLVRE